MGDVRFTFDSYQDLLDRFTNAGYTYSGFTTDAPERSVILRHDVDWSPRKAVRMAKIEASAGALATYCFLVSSPFYNVMNAEVRGQIRQIRSLGHEIGLHFSTHQHFDGDPSTPEASREPPEDALVSAVGREREVVEAVSETPVNVVSFHNPPSWVFGRSFVEFTSTYEPKFFEEIEYVADSNQRWREKQPFESGLPDRCQVLTHPVLWGERDAWTTDRLREERDYLFERIDDHLRTTDRTWD